MDNRTVQLLPASFKGVSFSVRAERITEGGRRLVLHDYVNSDELFVEDQGAIPQKFSVRAFVHGPDYIARARQLADILNERGSGILTLPVLGSVEAYSGTYSQDASQTAVGEIVFDLAFTIGRPQPGPAVADVSIEDVYQLGDEARLSMQTEFGLDQITPTTSFNGVRAATDLNNTLGEIRAGVKSLVNATDLATIDSRLNTIAANTAKLVRDPAALADLVFSGDSESSGIWQAISVGVSEAGSSADAISAMIDLTGVGPDYLWPATTAFRIQRNTIRQKQVQAQRIMALVGLYEVIAAATYQTFDDINSTRSQAEDIHEQIMRVESDDVDAMSANPELREAVEKVRIASLAILQQKEQEVFGIEQIEITSPRAAFVLSYALYADELDSAEALGERTAAIADFNTALRSDALEGTVNVFQVRDV